LPGWAITSTRLIAGAASLSMAKGHNRTAAKRPEISSAP
jgi:hypothetical protein